MRAILLASATATSRMGFRASNRPSQLSANPGQFRVIPVIPGTRYFNFGDTILNRSMGSE